MHRELYLTVQRNKFSSTAFLGRPADLIAFPFAWVCGYSIFREHPAVVHNAISSELKFALLNVTFFSRLLLSGALLFTIEEFLMPQQITALFSGLVLHSRQQVEEGDIHEEDISAPVEESNFDDVGKNVNQNVNLHHPIIVDQYDVCQLVHNKELKKITINMMVTLKVT